MDNAEIMQSLRERAREERKVRQKESDLSKYVLFLVGKKQYALKADQVREISFDNELYYVPFVPPYVRGYANRHGQPFTVFDVQMLFEGASLDSSTLLILDVANDQLALLITDVDEIIKLPASEIHPLASSDDTARYFAHSVTARGEEVFVLNVETLLERLERDVERA
jgi:purine-binding chemotaxis protein CheW